MSAPNHDSVRLFRAVEAAMAAADPDQEMNYSELARACVRVVAAEVEILTDALIEFYDFVAVHLDPHPSPLEDYLVWPAERKAELRKALRLTAQNDGSGGDA